MNSWHLRSSGWCEPLEEQQHPEEKGPKDVKRPAVLAVALAFVSIWAVLAAGLTAVWLTEEVRVVGLVMLPTAIVASLLVLYFEWRGRLPRRVRSERDAHENLDKAA